MQKDGLIARFGRAKIDVKAGKCPHETIKKHGIDLDRHKKILIGLANKVGNPKGEYFQESDMNEETKHRVSVTVSDPHHNAVTMRSARIQKTIRVGGKTKEEAITRAKRHYRKLQFRVHDASHIEELGEDTNGQPYPDTIEEGKQKPYVSKVGRHWHVLDANGKSRFKAVSAGAANAHLERHYDRYKYDVKEDLFTQSELDHIEEIVNANNMRASIAHQRRKSRVMLKKGDKMLDRHLNKLTSVYSDKTPEGDKLGKAIKAHDDNWNPLTWRKTGKNVDKAVRSVEAKRRKISSDGAKTGSDGHKWREKGLGIKHRLTNTDGSDNSKNRNRAKRIKRLMGDSVEHEGQVMTEDKSVQAVVDLISQQVGSTSGRMNDGYFGSRIAGAAPRGPLIEDTSGWSSRIHYHKSGRTYKYEGKVKTDKGEMHRFNPGRHGSSWPIDIKVGEEHKYEKTFLKPRKK